MSEDKSGGRAALVAAIALAAGTLLVRFPPMTDLPLHAATVGLLRHFSDPAFVPPGLYTWNFGHANQLFHLLAWALSYPLGVDGACKLVVAASQVGIVLGGLRLARHVGASSWCALLFVPIAIGWTFRFGLVANLLGVGLLFAALPDLDDASAGPRVPGARSLGRSCLWMVVLYAAHFSVVVIAALIVGLFALLRARRDGLRALLLRLLPSLFAGALVGAQQVAQRLTIATQGLESGGVVWRSPLQNALELPYTLTGLPDVAVSCALALLTLLGIASFAASGVHANRFLLVAAFLLGASLITPFGIARGTLFSQRFFAPGLGLLVVGLAARTTPSPVTRLQRLLAGAVPLAFVAFLVPELVDADRQNRALDQLLVRMQPGSAVVAIEADPDKGDRSFALVSTAARAVAWHGGRINMSFNESVISPVLLRPEHVWHESAARLGNNTVDFEPQRDFALFRYALVHTRNAAIRAVAPEVMAPEGRMLGQAGEWQLFETTGTVVPLTAPEPPPPDGDLETFRVRSIRALARLAHARTSADAAPVPGQYE